MLRKIFNAGVRGNFPSVVMFGQDRGLDRRRRHRVNRCRLSQA
jgi:hypothetical protein